MFLLGVRRDGKRNENEEDKKELVVHIQGNYGLLLLLFLIIMGRNVS